MIVVPDAGPLIYLAGAGQLSLLPRLFAQVIVPQLVYDEVVVHGAGQIGAAEVEAATWLHVADATPDGSLLAVLDKGEAAAIPLAQRLGATLLVDDGDARALAIERGLVVIGTLGVLVLAKRRGLVTQVAPIIELMQGLGMFVASALHSAVLRAADET